MRCYWIRWFFFSIWDYFLLVELILYLNRKSLSFRMSDFPWRLYWNARKCRTGWTILYIYIYLSASRHTHLYIFYIYMYILYIYSAHKRPYRYQPPDNSQSGVEVRSIQLLLQYQRANPISGGPSKAGRFHGNSIGKCVSIENAFSFSLSIYIYFFPRIRLYLWFHQTKKKVRHFICLLACWINHNVIVKTNWKIVFFLKKNSKLFIYKYNCYTIKIKKW